MLSARDLPHPGIETTSPAWQADSLLLSYWGNLNLQVTSPRLGLRFLEEFHFVLDRPLLASNVSVFR